MGLVRGLSSSLLLARSRIGFLRARGDGCDRSVANSLYLSSRGGRALLPPTAFSAVVVCPLLTSRS